jgi:hypothetical protein
MGAPDCILDGDGEFLAQLRVTVAVVSADPAAYHLSPAQIAELQAMLAADDAPLRDQRIKTDAARVPAPDATPVGGPRGARPVALRVRVLFANRPEGDRPAGVPSVAVVTAVGPDAPLGLDGCAWQGNFTRSRLTLNMHAENAGETVWITAVPLNARGECGPMSNAVAATVAA